MIELSINKKGYLEVRHQAVSPIVYLDHWALRKFSEDQALGSRLTTALELQVGTLALSFLNLAEFTKVTIEEQARKAEILIEANLPRVFFIDSDPFAVIDKENKLLAGEPLTPPHQDQDFLKMFTELAPTLPKPFTSRDLFSAVQNGEIANDFEILADTIVDRVEVLRNEYGINPEFRSAVGRSPRGPQIQRGTRFILRELMQTFLVDNNIKITRNQAIDLLHSVVPAAYCDLVLLDKHWETQVDRVRSRLKGTGMYVPIAKVFSGKANGVSRFLCELESNKRAGE